MMLADMGAEVIHIERGPLPYRDMALRHRRRVRADLKSAEGIAAVRALAERADVLIEGFRPGVAERLGIGPDECLAANPRLIYGRMTGWGQSGPMAALAGHDINYLSITGALNAIGPAAAPVPPLNLLGDFGAGSMLLVIGLLAALAERSSSGVGQVVDAAIVDGTALLSQMTWTARSNGAWSDSRQDNLLDGGAPFYSVYPCSDGLFMAVGAIEPQFFARLLQGLELDGVDPADQMNRGQWPRLARAIGDRFATRTRAEWTEVFAGLDACVTPVLDWAEALDDGHLRARDVLVDIDGDIHAAPAPRFSRTPSRRPDRPSADTEDVSAILAGWAS